VRVADDGQVTRPGLPLRGVEREFDPTLGSPVVSARSVSSIAT
jgi:hypothetical protein